MMRFLESHNSSVRNALGCFGGRGYAPDQLEELTSLRRPPMDLREDGNGGLKKQRKKRKGGGEL